MNQNRFHATSLLFPSSFPILDKTTLAKYITDNKKFLSHRKPLSHINHGETALNDGNNFVFL